MESGKIPSSVKKAFIDKDRTNRSINNIKAIPIRMQPSALMSRLNDFLKNMASLNKVFFMKCTICLFC